MKNVILTMPVNTLKRAVEIAQDVHTKFEKLDEKRKAFPETQEEVERLSGFEGVQKWKETLEEIDQEKKAVSAEAVAKIEDLKVEYQKKIDDQVVPKGSDVSGDNESDFRLLENGLVTDPEKLQKLVERHDNVAFRAMASNYAKSRGWDGFEYFDKESALREYGEEFLKVATWACEDGLGINNMLVTAEDELKRRSLAYGLIEEYNKGL